MREPVQRFEIAAHKLWGKCSIGRDTYISDMARVRGKLHYIAIGNNCVLHDFVVLVANADLELGNGVKLSYGSKILANDEIKLCANVSVGADAKIIAEIHRDTKFTAKIEIGTGAIIGPGAVILAGAKIPAGKIIRANEVVDGRTV